MQDTVTAHLSHTQTVQELAVGDTKSPRIAGVQNLDAPGHEGVFQIEEVPVGGVIAQHGIVHGSGYRRNVGNGPYAAPLYTEKNIGERIHSIRTETAGGSELAQTVFLAGKTVSKGFIPLLVPCQAARGYQEPSGPKPSLSHCALAPKRSSRNPPYRGAKNCPREIRLCMSHVHGAFSVSGPY